MYRNQVIHKKYLKFNMMCCKLPESCSCLLFFSFGSLDGGWPVAGGGTGRLTGRTFLNSITGYL